MRKHLRKAKLWLKPRMARQWPRLLWLLALGAVVAAVWLSHLWDSKSGVDIGFVVLFLGVLSLALAPVRKALEKVSSVKTPFLELTLSEATQTAAERVLVQVPNVEEGDEGDGRTRSSGPLRLIEDLWPADPSASLALLRRRLKVRLNWTLKEMYSSKRIASIDYMGSLAELQSDGLLPDDSLKISRAILAIPEQEMVAVSEGDRDRLDPFMRAADRVVYQLRLSVLDRWVRQQLEARGFELIDFDQPQRRWPDFLARQRRSGAEGDLTLRVAVRIALIKDSKLLNQPRKRLVAAKAEGQPVAAGAEGVIVVPDRSDTELRGKGPVREVKRSDLPNLLDQLG